MLRCLRLIIYVFFTILPHLASAQTATENPLVIEEHGAAYLRAIRLSGIDADVAYFDPTRPPPPLETSQEPKAPPEQRERRVWSGNIELPALLISAAVLLAIVYVFVRFGGGISVSLGGTGNAKRGRKDQGRKTGPLATAAPGSLNDILRIRDRREALIRLAQTALMAAVSANGVLIQRSWTARDALRHLPKNQSHIDALRNLVHASERVHFGGRDISEDEFLTHVEDIRPLLSGAMT